MYISGSLTPELVVPIHRNGGSQTPDRWFKVVRNIQLLQVAEEMANWLNTFSGDNFDYQVRLLNQLQIQKRKRLLSTDELQQLCEIIESPDSREDIKVGAYLLMDNQIAAKIHFAKLTPEIQEEFKSYPIFHFFAE